MTQAEEELRMRLKRTLEHVQEWRDRLWQMSTGDLPCELQNEINSLTNNMASLLQQNKR